MTGGLGNDSYVVDALGDKAVESSTTGGTDTVESAVGFVLGTNLENLTLTGAGDLNATGNALANVLTGNSGNNVLDGKLGADAMSGGGGNDTYVVDNLGDTASEEGGSGTDLVRSGVTYTLGSGVENLTLTGSAAVNGSGNELVNQITGNAAANLLSGLGGDDHLFGLGGNDRLDGGGGADGMTGGAGNDIFLLSLGEISNDAIFDFVGNGASLGDSLLFQGFDDSASLSHVGDLWTVSYDGGASDETFQIVGVTSLAAGDYLFA
jgi:Ca2+-binding RTX toxin-like protein